MKLQTASLIGGKTTKLLHSKNQPAACQDSQILFQYPSLQHPHESSLGPQPHTPFLQAAFRGGIRGREHF